MSLIPPVGGPIGLPTPGMAIGHPSAATAARAAEHVAGPPSVPAVDSAEQPQDGFAVEQMLRDALTAVVDHARLMQWIERIESAETPSAWLILRPEPDGDRPIYPSPIGAYQEISQLINAL